jgi:hypothetical protein
VSVIAVLFISSAVGLLVETLVPVEPERGHLDLALTGVDGLEPAPHLRVW